jgi:hypothetical protein
MKNIIHHYVFVLWCPTSFLYYFVTENVNFFDHVKNFTVLQIIQVFHKSFRDFGGL